MRRQRSDTAAAAIAAMKAATDGVINCPVELPEGAEKYWFAIMTTKHPDAWTPNDLFIAAQLAQVEYEIDRLLADGFEKMQDSEEMIYHPHMRAVDQLIARELMMAKTLQIHSLAANGKAQDQPKRNQLFRDAAASVTTSEHGDLIATPKMH